ncbi:MAG: uroporphyrinogen-III synthase [Phycisphaerales bacterium JB038]
MRVWVTRDEPEDGPLSTALRAVGLTPVVEPVVQRRVVDDCREQVEALGPDDWLVLTSPYAIESVAREPAKTPRLAVVGEPSAELAWGLGFRVELMASEGTGESLWRELQPFAAGRTICYPRSSKAKPPTGLADVALVSPVLYETTARDFDRGVLERVDVIALASPSAVRSIGRTDLPCASIGPVTSRALRELDIEPWREAASSSFEALARVIAG